MKMLLAMMALLLAGPVYASDDKAPTEVKRIGVPAPADAPVKDVEITAQKYEFSPSEVEIPVNTLIRFHLKAIDREHGFEVKSFKDSCVKFKPRRQRQSSSTLTKQQPTSSVVASFAVWAMAR